MLCAGRGGVPSKPQEYAGWYLRLNMHGCLLRRGSSSCGWVGGLPGRLVGAEAGVCRVVARVRCIPRRWGSRLSVLTDLSLDLTLVSPGHRNENANNHSFYFWLFHFLSTSQLSQRPAHKFVISVTHYRWAMSVNASHTIVMFQINGLRHSSSNPPEQTVTAVCHRPRSFSEGGANSARIWRSNPHPNSPGRLGAHCIRNILAADSLPCGHCGGDTITDAISN